MNRYLNHFSIDISWMWSLIPSLASSLYGLAGLVTLVFIFLVFMIYGGTYFGSLEDEVRARWKGGNDIHFAYLIATDSVRHCMKHP